jgi:magnesium chelatase family protein
VRFDICTPARADFKVQVHSGARCNNAHITTRLIRKYCALDEAGERTLEMAVRRMGLSARAHDRILKLGETFADLERSEPVSANLDRNYWS